MTAYYQFDGIPFGPRSADQQPLPGPGESFTSLRHVPYSNYSILDMGGLGPDVYAVPIRLLPVNVADMLGRRQLSGVLIAAGVNYGRATLTKLTNKTTDPVHGKYVWFDAEWVIG